MKNKERKDPAKLAAENEDYSEDSLRGALKTYLKEKKKGDKK